MNNKNITVYLVEDYSLTRIGLKLIFQKFSGIKLVGDADDACVALKEIFRIKPDVVLMDIGLPGMNGLEATYKIKNSMPQTKVIILSSHNNEGEVLAALGSGATGYCLKDISSELLEEVIKMIDRGVCYLDGAIANSVLKYFPKFDSVQNLKNVELRGDKYSLSNRELHILSLITEGKSNEEISNELKISIHTTKVHIKNIFTKLSVSDRVQAAVKAVKEKLIEL